MFFKKHNLDKAEDPEKVLRQAYRILYLITILYVGLGVFMGYLYLKSAKPEPQEIGFISLGLTILGATYGVLGFFISRRSETALTAAVVLLTMELIATFILTYPRLGFGILLKVAFLALVYKGFDAVNRLNERDELGGLSELTKEFD